MDQDNKKSNWLKAAVILCGILVLLIYFINFKAVSEFFSWFNGIFMPVFIGIIIAYLLNPIMSFYEDRVFVWKKNTKAKVNLCRALSILMTIITGIAIIALTLVLIIPQLVNSIKFFIDNFDSYLSDSINSLNTILSNTLNDGIPKEYISLIDIQQYINSLTSFDDNIIQSIVESVSAAWGTISTVGTNVVVSSVTFFKNWIVGFFIAFYILITKELRIAQFKKIRVALLPEKVDAFIEEVMQVADKSFGGFINGKIIDSLIIGILSFIVFQIFKVSEFNILLATFIGITNVVPVFGPIFGAIPAGFIVLVTNPSKVLIFIILVVLIQQLDGNVIGPAILGNSTQISTLAVVVSIVVFGNLFGVFGMIIGVPLTATIVTISKRILEKRLTEQHKSTAVEDYFIKKIAVVAESEEHKAEKTWYYKYTHNKANKNHKEESKPADDNNDSTEENDNNKDSAAEDNQAKGE